LHIPHWARPQHVKIVGPSQFMHGAEFSVGHMAFSTAHGMRPGSIPSHTKLDQLAGAA
jgi:hypothetical protein